MNDSDEAEVENGDEPPPPPPPTSASELEGAVELVRSEVEHYKKRRHLQYYHKNCVRAMADEPMFDMKKGDPLEPPKKSALNRDRRAANALLFAGGTVELLI